MLISQTGYTLSKSRFNEETLWKAYESGNRKAIELHFNSELSHEPLFLRISALFGDGEIFLRLLDRFKELPESILSDAVDGGNILIVRKLLDLGAPLSARAVEVAAMQGRLEILQLLVSRGASSVITEDAINFAFSEDHTEVVDYLISIGAPVGRLSSKYGDNPETQKKLKEYYKKTVEVTS